MRDFDLPAGWPWLSRTGWTAAMNATETATFITESNELCVLRVSIRSLPLIFQTLTGEPHS